MKRGTCSLGPLMVLLLMAAIGLAPLAALQAQDAPKEAAKPEPIAGKAAAQDDMATRIQKLEETVKRLESELRTRPLPPPNPMGIVIMAQTFAFIGMGIGALAFIRAGKLKKEIDELRKGGDKPNSTEGPGLTNG